MPKHSEYFFGPVSLLTDPRLEPFCSLRGITPEGICMKIMLINHVLWLNRNSNSRVPVKRLLRGLNGGRYKYAMLEDLVFTTGLFDCNHEGVLYHPELLEPIPNQIETKSVPVPNQIRTTSVPLPNHIGTTSVPNACARINTIHSKNKDSESESESEIYDVVDAWVRDPDETGLPSADKLKKWLVTLLHAGNTQLCELCAMRSGIRNLREYWEESIVEFAKHLTTAGNLKGVNSISELRRYLLYSFSVKGVTRSPFFPGRVIVDKLKERKRQKVIEMQQQYPFEIINEHLQRFADGFHIPDYTPPRPNNTAQWNPEGGFWETDSEDYMETDMESCSKSNTDSDSGGSSGNTDYGFDVVSQYMALHTGNQYSRNK